MSAYNIEGYVQGYKFNQDNYNAIANEFIDQAGYGVKNACKVTAGAPIFETVNENECVLLDNTWHAKMISAIPYEGSFIAVVKPNVMTGSSVSTWPIMNGDSASAVSNSGVLYQHVSGDRNLMMWTSGGFSLLKLSRSDDNAIVVAFSRNQSTNALSATSDGVSVSTINATVSTTQGGPASFGAGLDGSRFGQLSNDSSDTTKNTDLTLNFFELHFFADDILNNQLADTKSFIDELKLKYSAS